MADRTSWSPARPASSASTSRSGCCEHGRAVVGLDNVNDYYDPKLKEARLEILRKFPSFRFVKLDLARSRGRCCICSRSIGFPTSCISRRRPACAIRSKIRTPMSTPTSRASSTCSKAAGTTAVKHLLYASSSSVYGANTKMPFSVHDNVDHPISLYAATKKANELMAHAYSHLFACRRRACGSSRSMDRGAGPTWRCSFSQRRSWRAGRSSCSITATCGAISLTSTTWRRRSCV